MNKSDHETAKPSAAEHWEARYRAKDQVWSGRVNAVVQEVAAGLNPGSALDLGCGEGGDVLWLAQNGWTVTGVDISPTAIQRGQAAAAELRLPDSTVTLVAADLIDWSPGQHFELVSCSFLHSWHASVPREDILRRAAGFVAPGGRLLITAHAAPMPWMAADEHEHRQFPTPQSDLEALRLDPILWEVEKSELREREVVGRDGNTGVMTDGVLLLRRKLRA